MQKLLCFFVKRGIISIALSGQQCLHGFAGADTTLPEWRNRQTHRT